MISTLSTLSLEEFKANPGDVVRMAGQTSEPIIIRSEEGPSLILQSEENYNQLLERLDYLEAVEAIREGLRDVEEGRVYPAREAFAALAEELGIQD